MGAGFCSLYREIHYIEVCYIKVWVYFNCILKKKVLVPILQVILLQTLCCCVLIVLSPETTIKKTLTLLLLDQKKIARFFSNAQWDKEFPKVGGCLGIWYEIFGWYSLSSPRGISLGLWIPLFKYDYILLYNSGHITYKGSLSSHAKSAKNYIFDEQIPNPCKLNLKARPKSLYNLLLLHSILPIVQYRDSKALASERSSHIWGWQF